jgi:ABC-type antimicrobial peptide transport system permease subunit
MSRAFQHLRDAFRQLRKSPAFTAVAVISLALGWRWLQPGCCKTQLFAVKPSDPFTIFAALLRVTIISLLAGYLPARRATRIDPMAALRYE